MRSNTVKISLGSNFILNIFYESILFADNAAGRHLLFILLKD